MRTLIALLATITMSAQDGYFVFDGGYTNDLNFSGALIGNVGRAVGEFEYFYSNYKETISMSAGVMPIKENRWKMVVVFGTEINNDWRPRMSTEFWHRVGRGDGWLKLGVQSINSDVYVNFGLAVGIHPSKTKVKRFF